MTGAAVAGLQTVTLPLSCVSPFPLAITQEVLYSSGMSFISKSAGAEVVSRKAKARWADPSYQAKMKESRGAGSSVALSVAEKAKARWADPAFRERMQAKLKAFWANQENRERMQAADTAGWVGRDDRREAVAQGVSAARKGKPLSPEHRAAIKSAMANVSYEIRHHTNPATREKMRAALLGHPLTQEQKDKLSVAQHAYQESIRPQREELRKARLLEAKGKWHFCKCKEGCDAVVKDPDKLYARGHHPATLANLTWPHDYGYLGIRGLIMMAGSWEVFYAQYMDSKGVEWEYETKRHPFLFEGKQTSYTPDFYLPATNEYIEVKGYYRLDNRIRMAAFKRQHPELKLHFIFEEEYNAVRAALGLPPEKQH